MSTNFVFCNFQAGEDSNLNYTVICLFSGSYPVPDTTINDKKDVSIMGIEPNVSITETLWINVNFYSQIRNVSIEHLNAVGAELTNSPTFVFNGSSCTSTAIYQAMVHVNLVQSTFQVFMNKINCMI